MANATKRITEAAALFVTLYAARRYYRNWGATKAECQMRLPGDRLVADPAIQTTEAVYIDASSSTVWSWLLQMAQEHAGFNGVEGLNNEVGLGHPDAGRVHPKRHSVSLADTVPLAPGAWMRLAAGATLSVAEIVPEKYLVLHLVRPGLRWNAVWSVHLQPHWEDRVRLLTRVRIALRYPGEVFALELARPVIALTTRGLLLAIKHRAERHPTLAQPRTSKSA